MPPHSLFIEAFAGTGQILLHKRPAQASIAIDSDAAVCEALKRSVHARNGEGTGVNVICADAISWLERNRCDFNLETLVYCDPPYLFETRADPGRRYYRRECGGEWFHGELLAVLSRLTTQDVRVLISGYRSPLYDERLSHWRRVDYRAGTRRGGVTESLWCNFDAPAPAPRLSFPRDQLPGARTAQAEESSMAGQTSADDPGGSGGRNRRN